MPVFEVRFRPRAAKAFAKLDQAVQRQLAKKLKERCANPRVEADAVREIPGAYKIKLRARGIRLIYQVRDQQLVILVLAVAKREREDAYDEALREYKTFDD